MLFFWASTLEFILTHADIAPEVLPGGREAEQDGEGFRVHRLMKTWAEQQHTERTTDFLLQRERGTYKNYQWFAGSHLLGSPGSTQPLALQYSAMSKRGSEKPGTDPRLFTPWLTSSQSPPIRCHLHPRSCTKSARQCVNLLSLKLMCTWAGAKITL